MRVVLMGNGERSGPLIRVTANGKVYQITSGTTVAQFIRGRELDPQYVVVEHNGEALERAKYEDVRLGDGDRLELVRAVAGG
jgi:thiamine biosynthesis protein ThiS